MGQLVLGVRSLFVRLAIFIVMAILLAWALGGTLWPRPVSATAITSPSDGASWSWIARISSLGDPMLTYTLQHEGGSAIGAEGGDWVEVAGFVDSGKSTWTAARVHGQGWQLIKLSNDGSVVSVEPTGTRLDADRALLERAGPALSDS